MVNLCDYCDRDSRQIAYKKVLILSSDPSVTIWVCNEHLEKFTGSDEFVIGDEDHIEQLWQEEEADREAYFVMWDDPRESNVD